MARKNRRAGRSSSRKAKAGGKNTRSSKMLTANDKLVLYLNEALSMENATATRLQLRIKETRLQDVRQQLEHHLEETREQQERLRNRISSLSGKPPKYSAELPTPAPPKNLFNAIRLSMTPAGRELEDTKEDAVIENAEVVMYDMMTQNLNEEKEMADWIRTNTPAMLTRLFPEIQSSIAQQEIMAEGTRAEPTSAAEA
jgi:bacterioferritin (cytochrome b1)